MNHIRYEQWMAYVANEVDELTRDEYEQHLYDCEQCLELYMQAIESQVSRLPKLTDEFTEHVVTNVMNQSNVKPIETKALSKSKNSFFHYVIAAAMTLILMSSGIFSQLTQAVSTLEESPSFTETLLDKTLSFMQVMERNKEEK